MEHIQTVVIGAGVIGLACAKILAESGREVIVLEAADSIGSETSSRNSEVMHAGIYYPKDSLKARFCVAGKMALYDYCESHGVPYQRCGKLIVATTAQEEGTLNDIVQKARNNGVTDLEFITGQAAMALEPALSCTSALLSPSTGIIDSHALMLAYQGDAESCGAMIACNSPVLGGRRDGQGIVLSIGGADPMDLCANEVIVAAGLHSQTVARAIVGVPTETIPGQFFCKGSYFITATRSPFQRLIYPVPAQAGLGVHVTIDLAGGLRFGPDTEWIDGLADPNRYAVDPDRAQGFYAAVRRYYPALPDGALSPGYSGIRPKLSPPGRAADDFQIDGPGTHYVPGLVCLYGMESPGLTASLAIARHVLGLLAADQ
ncbi:MAG TPA: FAD-dependent oxidoreductase [Rhodospirillaceae bacterium]|nr:FAD-dependent oxidoreductase [Rhodospirillaceae bacterium]MAX62209.1 FAD-dependent oxidoreductase [Rhodospirillaceae bacterium]HAE03850.1 FAD-dependent oxidoreductase [Rhodospirillaceae bacterium]|tara:strand:- start:41608 stop:42729 length:1122 start_codon:yes stop_codon:yes gene_type:complete